MLNEPYFLSVEAASALTDQLAYRYYFMRYMPKPVEERLREHGAALSQAEQVEASQTLEEKKLSYFALCASFGMNPKATNAAWAKYLREGKT